MKKNISFFCVVLILVFGLHTLLAQTDCSKIPQKPNPPVAVNDLANIIDDVIQQSLERQLRDYFDKTTISLVVVTINTLDGTDETSYAQNLFDCWGPGGKNNAGIILLIAMKEHRIRIHTGYGVEGSLPDAECKKIIDKDITPLFKAGDYNAGIVKGVTSILTVTGPQNWEQRMEAQRIKDAERKRVTRQIITFVILTLIVIFIALITYFVVRWINQLLKKNRLRTNLRSVWYNLNKKITTARTMIAALFNDCQSAPAWARTEAAEHMNQANSKLAEAEQILHQVTDCINEDLSKADSLLLAARTLIDKAEKNYRKTDEALRNKVKKFAAEAPIKAKSAQETIEANINYTHGLIDRGYKLNEALIGQTDLKVLLEKKLKHLGDREFDNVIYSESDIIKAKSNELVAAAQEMVKLKEEIDSNMPNLIETAIQLRSDGHIYEGVIEFCKKFYPKNVWEGLESSLHRLKAKVSRDAIDKLDAEIKQSNSMLSQKFQLAGNKYKDFLKLLQDGKELYGKITEVNKQQETAKAQYPLQYKEVEAVVQKALNKIKDSDVGSRARTMAKNAATKLKETKIESSTSIVDWVILMNILLNAHSLANDAINQAKHDIEEAEKERKRKEEEEEEERETSLYSDSYYSSNSDSNSVSTSDFGGFDGGMSGGGGASGGW